MYVCLISWCGVVCSWCFDSAVEMDDARDLAGYNFEGDGLKALADGETKVSSSERVRASLRCGAMPPRRMTPAVIACMCVGVCSAMCRFKATSMA
jgi:hypothetical protein